MRSVLIVFSIFLLFPQAAIPCGPNGFGASGERSQVKNPVKSKALVKEFPEEKGKVVAVEFTPDGKSIGILSEADTVTIRNATDGKLVKSIKTCGKIEYSHRALAFSKKSKLMAVGAGGYICIYETDTWKLKNKILTVKSVVSLEFSNDDKYLLSATEQWSVSLFHTDTWKVFKKIPVMFAATSAHFSEDNKFILIPEWHSTIIIYDFPSLKRVKIIKTGAVNYKARFSPDGKYLATAGGDDGYSFVYDTKTWKLVYKLAGHKKWLKDVVFSDDSKQVITVGYDATIRVWSVKTGKEINKMTGHTWGINTLAKYKKIIATGASDKKVITWKLEGLINPSASTP
ncbi:hypothetical protein KKF34_07270 [Myxococcota bacterium]|nr:hypothetical protein [Myxococcota bacterium]MBU1382342.1 hypothetical protein [Myxococcota bacterium]MBU1496659.1 hypothetical protein [Myxococcota bacterium]